MSSGVACAIFLFHHIRLLSVFQITNLREYEKHALFMCFFLPSVDVSQNFGAYRLDYQA